MNLLLQFRCVGVLVLMTGCAQGAADDVADGQTATGGGGGTGGKLNGLGGQASDAQVDCVEETLTSTLIKKPLDIVIYLDSSSSMGTATAAIKANFDKYFSQKLVDSGIDYRVIAISAAPPVPNPADPSRYFFYPRGTGSGSLTIDFLVTFSTPPAANQEPLKGWSQWCRPEASKALFAITDSGSGPKTPALEFEHQLYDIQVLPGFGTREARNYRFHFMSGFIPNPSPEKPWLPTDPVVTQAKCANVGVPGQDLAILTGGLRFSMCEDALFDEYFEALAVSEVEKVPVSCSFPVPNDTKGAPVDPNTLDLEYTESGTKHAIHQVHGLDECASGGFYVEGSTVELCPITCSEVQAALDSKLTVKHGCPTSFVPE
jgi:hypothetical protein